MTSGPTPGRPRSGWPATRAAIRVVRERSSSPRAPEPGQPPPGELGLDAGERPEEPTDGPLMADGDEVGGPRPVSRLEAPEVGVETVPDPGHLDDDVFPGLDEELQVEGSIGGPDRRQVGLAGGHPGDREGIVGIALAETTRPGPLAAGELRRDLSNGHPGLDEEAGGGGPETGRALDPDDDRGVGLLDPGEQATMPGRVVVEGRLGRRRPQDVDAAGRQCRLVGVDPDRAHARPPPLRHTMAPGQAGSSASR